MPEQQFDLNRFQEWAKGMKKMESQFHFFQLLGEFPAMIDVVAQEVNFVKSLRNEQANLRGEIERIKADVEEMKKNADEEKRSLERSLEAAKHSHNQRMTQENEATKKALDEFQETRRSLDKEIERAQAELRQVIATREQEEGKLKAVRQAAETLKTEFRELRG